MVKWWVSLTDEGQMMLLSLALTTICWLITLVAILSCFCFGYAGVIPHVITVFTGLTYANAGILTVFLTHSGVGRVWGKPDNMKDIVNQKEDVQ